MYKHFTEIKNWYFNFVKKTTTINLNTQYYDYFGNKNRIGKVLNKHCDTRIIINYVTLFMR